MQQTRRPPFEFAAVSLDLQGEFAALAPCDDPCIGVHGTVQDHFEIWQQFLCATTLFNWKTDSCLMDDVLPICRPFHRIGNIWHPCFPAPCL